ncbi:hypothetical protein [Roseibium aggregatum]|uniref:Uncharacterized protein n=1 Tax=Roseibium aggregatum TaxID=187304 RepID=A0A926S7F8_9HYPH|nr:hypothetical protein [Roseibium aggregatum]MBD1549608.1 hypothetical protein [Roseibium aggregatum]
MAKPSNTQPPASSYEEPHSYGQDARHASFEEEDSRWRSHWIDWLILSAMIAVSLGYHLAIFFFQPGLG